MALLTADQVRPGMVVAADVTDRRGRLLIPAGKELTERHTQALRMWGITHLDVEGDKSEDEILVDRDPDAVAEAEAAVDSVLRHNDIAHPFIEVLRETAIKSHLETVSTEGEAA